MTDVIRGTISIADEDGVNRAVAYEHWPSIAGKADALTYVLVPGMGTTLDVYRELVPLLHNNGQASVVCTDLRGMGASDVGFTSYTPLDTARDVRALIAKLDLVRVVLVGGSMAAASVVWTAATDSVGGGNAPRRVIGVALLGPFAWDHDMPFAVPTLLSAMLIDCWGAWAWAGYYKTLFKAPPAGLDAHVANIRANLAQPGRLAALRGHIFASKAPCAARLPELSELKLPVLAIWGDKDPDFPGGVEHEGAELLRRVPHAEVHVFAGGGHYPMFEAPAYTAEKLRAFAAAAVVRIA